MSEKYEVVRHLGNGGVSSVYLVWDTHLLKYWAMKEIIKHRLDERWRNVETVLSEVRILKELEHPALPKIIDFFETEASFFLVMDYVEGETLAQLLERSGPQAEVNVIDWTMQLCDVLHYLHSQNPPIVFRDIKPGNIMLCPDGRIKLIDFGIARQYQFNRLEDTIYLGTRGFAAPEQFGDGGQTDPRTDVFGLGATLYQLLTGHHPTESPYEALSIRKWQPLFSFTLESIVLKATSQNPDNRFQTIVEMKKALLRMKQSQVVEVHLKKKKRFIRMFIAGLLAIVILYICLARNQVLMEIQKLEENANLVKIEKSVKKIAHRFENYFKKTFSNRKR